MKNLTVGILVFLALSVVASANSASATPHPKDPHRRRPASGKVHVTKATYGASADLFQKTQIQAGGVQAVRLKRHQVMPTSSPNPHH